MCNPCSLLFVGEVFATNGGSTTKYICKFKDKVKQGEFAPYIWCSNGNQNIVTELSTYKVIFILSVLNIDIFINYRQPKSLTSKFLQELKFSFRRDEGIPFQREETHAHPSTWKIAFKAWRLKKINLSPRLC